MRAKLVNEAIKHLTPKSEEETGRPYYNYVEKACKIVEDVWKNYISTALFWYNEEAGEETEEWFNLIDFVYLELKPELLLAIKENLTPEEFAKIIIDSLKVYSDTIEMRVKTLGKDIRNMKVEESIKHLTPFSKNN